VSWRIGVDRDQCIGSGVCAGTAPAHFRLEAGRSLPVEELAGPAEEIMAAAESCPVEAITVHDGSGRRLAPD
jgi:ferredoxin